MVKDQQMPTERDPTPPPRCRKSHAPHNRLSPTLLVSAGGDRDPGPVHGAVVAPRRSGTWDPRHRAATAPRPSRWRRGTDRAGRLPDVVAVAVAAVAAVAVAAAAAVAVAGGGAEGEDAFVGEGAGKLDARTASGAWDREAAAHWSSYWGRLLPQPQIERIRLRQPVDPWGAPRSLDTMPVGCCMEAPLPKGPGTAPARKLQQQTQRQRRWGSAPVGAG